MFFLDCLPKTVLFCRKKMNKALVDCFPEERVNYQCMVTSPKLSEKTLDLLGLKAKDLQVYTALLKLGTAPLRRVAEEANLNRGTTYDALKRLLDLGMVSYVDAKTHRYFTAEDPERLRGLATRREVALQEIRSTLEESVIPNLKHIHGTSAHRPVVRYYEGDQGVREILEDVLASAEQAESTYRVYSSAAIRDLISAAWPGYNKKRIRKKIFCKAISVGEGGSTVGHDERKWLSREEESPTYIFIYAGKTAYVSVDDRRHLFGVLIEDEGIARTQKLIFDQLWNVL